MKAHNNEKHFNFKNGHDYFHFFNANTLIPFVIDGFSAFPNGTIEENDFSLTS